MTTTATREPVTLTGTPDAAERPPRSSRSFGYWLAGIAGVGMLIRLLNVFWWRPTTNRPGYLGYRLWGDAFYFHWQANTLADGKFFINPVRYVFEGGVEVPSAGHPPLYTIYLSLWSLVGIDSVTAHRVVSGFLGVATIVVVALVGRQLLGSGVGLIAGAIVAVYPFMWINDGMLMSESLVVLMAALTLAAAYSFVANPRPRQAVLLGLACAGSALTRSEMLLLLPLLVVPLALLVRTLPWKRRVALGAIGCGVALAVIAPWVAYNLSRFEEPVFLSTGVGQTLQAGACDKVFYGELTGYYWPCFSAPASAETLDESQRDVILRDHAFDYLDAHRSRIPVVVAARIGRVWGVFAPGNTTMMDWWFEGRGRAPSWISLFFYYAMIPFAVVGIVTMWRRKITLVPIVALAVIVTFAAAIAFGITRYRAPFEVALALVAAIGIHVTWRALRSRGARAVESA
jgi:4-amino-4-deoxy-L-arabinose transferase-like glycosyltransferase